MDVYRRYIKKTLIKAPVEQLSSYHEKPGAFHRLAPPWIPVKIVSKNEINIKTGTRVKFHIGWPKLFFSWESEHTDYKKNSFFKDIQIRGPFKFFEHTHRFIPRDDESSFMEDEIHFALPGRKLSSFLLPFVIKELERVFAYRHRVLQYDLENQENCHTPKRILIAGSSGTIGRALVPFLRIKGHEVIRLVRDGSINDSDTIFWDPYGKIADLQAHKPFDAVVSLNGVDIGQKRWSSHRKIQILDSRLIPTRFLAKTLSELSQPPKVWISASAIGYYSGSQSQKSEKEVDDTGALGSSFISSVCNEWEIVSLPAKKVGIRVVNIRTGVVLSPAGGALTKMLLPFKSGFGAVIGKGNQYMSWISMEDMIRGILHCIQTSSLQGPVNMTSPNPVSNRVFSKSLGRVYGKKVIWTLPEWLVKVVFGQMGKEALLSGLRVTPSSLQKSGFRFLFQDILTALRHTLGK